MYYDLEAIRRFVDTITKNGYGAGVPNNSGLTTFTITVGRQPTEPNEERYKNLLKDVQNEDILAAYRALAALINTGADLKKELGITRKPGPKNKRIFDMSIHSLEFMVLCSYAGGAITKPEAKNMLFRIGSTDERNTVDNFIRDRLGSAKKFITCFPYATGPSSPFTLVRDKNVIKFPDEPDEFKPFLSKQRLENEIKKLITRK